MLCDEGTRKKEGKESEDESLWEELELLHHKFVVIYSQITGVTSNACKSYILSTYSVIEILITLDLLIWGL